MAIARVRFELVLSLLGTNFLKQEQGPGRRQPQRKRKLRCSTQLSEGFIPSEVSLKSVDSTFIVVCGLKSGQSLCTNVS